MLCDNLGRWDGVGGGREVQEGGDICILMVDSHSYMAETTQHCKAIIFQLKINFKKYKNYRDVLQNTENTTNILQ